MLSQLHEVRLFIPRKLWIACFFLQTKYDLQDPTGVISLNLEHAVIPLLIGWSRHLIQTLVALDLSSGILF